MGNLFEKLGKSALDLGKKFNHEAVADAGRRARRHRRSLRRHNGY